MSSKLATVGFIGLGVMGLPMAKNLAAKLPRSYKLYVFDINEKVMEALSSQDNGMVVMCGSAKEVAAKSGIILSMVPEGSHVLSVYLSPETGVLAADLRDKMLIDCSTIDTTTSATVRQQIEESTPSTSFYDAPVSGGSLGAEKGTLTFMLGCAANDTNLPLIKGVLGMMGTSIFPCGGPSLGLIAKLCNNYCSGLIAIATAEAMNMGIRSGMDPRVLSSIFRTSTAQSTINDKWNPVPGVCPDAPASHGYTGGFKVQLMKKDFGLAVDNADKVGARMILGKAGLDAYTAASNDAKCRDLDSRVIFRLIGGKEDWGDDYSYGFDSCP